MSTYSGRLSGSKAFNRIAVVAVSSVKLLSCVCLSWVHSTLALVYLGVSFGVRYAISVLVTMYTHENGRKGYKYASSA